MLVGGKGVEVKEKELLISALRRSSYIVSWVVKVGGELKPFALGMMKALEGSRDYALDFTG
jgi:hypothetical protein